MKKSTEQPGIVFGVCGIGNGHTNRQLPLIEHFARKARLVILGYGESYAHFSKKFDGSDSVRVIPVEVPFIVGNHDGLDLEATARHPANQGRDFIGVNSAALVQMQKFLGRPDLAISDYEPISAQAAYANNAPLVTIDQQSKFLHGDFPDINEATCNDEIARLRMFFPNAAQRIATSFFNVKAKSKPDEIVDIYPVILKDEITSLRRHTARQSRSILLYLSSQQPFGQSVKEIADICSSQKDGYFNIFAPEKAIKALKLSSNKRVHIYQHGDANFYPVLQNCGGIVSTAGHTLISEAMHLGIPVYAIPFTELYEQQVNAQVIGNSGFGISHTSIDAEKLAEFTESIPDFATAIRNDRDVLLHGPSQQTIIEHLERKFLS